MVGVGTEGVSDSSTYDLEGVPMPWYWTDDLARILIDTGKVDPERARRWISAPVAIRSAEVDSETVASSLLSDEDGRDRHCLWPPERCASSCGRAGSWHMSSCSPCASAA